MGYTAALGFACIISLSACGESGRVEVSDREQTPAVLIQCSVGSLEARGRSLSRREVSGGEAAEGVKPRGTPHARRELQCNQTAAEPAIVALESSRVIPIVIPSGKTSSRRTVVSAAEVAKTEPPKLQLPEIDVAELDVAELDVPELDVPELDVAELDVPELDVAEIPELESESLAVLTPEPSAFEPQGEPKRSVLPPLPPLRNHGREASRTSDYPDQAELALASLQMSEPTSAVRHIASDIEPASSEETEQDKLADAADESAPLRRLQSNDVESTAPAILRNRSVISDSSLDPAPVAELRPIGDASSLELGLKEVRILHTRESIHRIVPSGQQVCEAVMLNPREIALIGRQRGTMQLDFWYDDQGTQRTRYSVTVQDEPTLQQVSMEESQRIETVIHQLFPGSRIECQREPARLIVRGYARNERQAIDIISTIRRSQLIPVVDLIEIRAQDRPIRMP